MEAHHTLICVPLNGIQVKARWLYNLVMTSLTLRRFDLSVFLLILPCWRVFFLGSPALHNAGTDRLQMVGVRSLHVDSSWLLVSSCFLQTSSALFYLQQLLKYVMTGTNSYAAHCFFNIFLNLVTKCWKFE